MTEGRVGDGDGWCSWTTRDDAWSYEPSVSCGEFQIVLGRGTEWGARSDKEVNLACYHFETHGEDTDAEYEPLFTVSVPWDLAALQGAAHMFAFRMMHPVPRWIQEAMEQLWRALHEPERRVPRRDDTTYRGRVTVTSAAGEAVIERGLMAGDRVRSDETELVVRDPIKERAFYAAVRLATEGLNAASEALRKAIDEL